jgi:pimeloyl-ACP methyl ester carboxylesterase
MTGKTAIVSIALAATALLACAGSSPNPHVTAVATASTATRAAPAPPVDEAPVARSEFEIPRLMGVRIDGSLEDWANRGLSIEVLAAANAERRPATEFDATARLGWDSEGLLIALDVLDTTHIESDTDSELYKNDSVELFAATKPGSEDFLQYMVSPGIDPRHPEPRWHFYDKRSSEKLLVNKPPIAFARSASSSGYHFEARMPWALLGVEPKQGSLLGVQFYVNDSGKNGDRRRLVWFPEDETHQYSSQMYSVRLSERASARVQVATSTAHKGRRRARLELATVTQTPDVVQLMDGTAAIGKTNLEVAGRLGVGQIAFDAPLDGKTRLLWLRGSHGPMVSIWQPDRSAARHKAIGDLRVIALPSVFGEAEFPKIDFTDPEAAESLLGPYKVKIRFYDSQHRLVERADKAGRYGAVVDIESDHAPVIRQCLTLFRLANKVHFWNERAILMGELPEGMGISSKVQKQQSAILGGLFMKMLGPTAYGMDPVPTTLAYLHEVSDTAPRLGPNNAARIANEVWWHEQRKQMGDLPAYKYLVHLPLDAKGSSNKHWPAILSLHGAGENGDDLRIVAHVGPLQKRALKPQAFPFIVITPQCPAREIWNVTLLADLVREVLDKYPIDPDRLYVTGGSMGGFGTWALAAAHPDWFAAAAVVSGGGDAEEARNLVNLPMWVIHGDDDEVVATERGIELVRALRALHGRVRFTLYHAVGHDAGSPTWLGDSLYDWFLQQRRGQPKQPRTTRTDVAPDERIDPRSQALISRVMAQ